MWCISITTSHFDRHINYGGKNKLLSIVIYDASIKKKKKKIR